MKTLNHQYTVKQIPNKVQKQIQLSDLKGYFIEIDEGLRKSLQYSELSEYGPLIYDTLTSYNNGIHKTMMVKGPRKSLEETTNRESHQKNVEYIATTIAETLGLNAEMVRIMARNHDTRTYIFRT